MNKLREKFKNFYIEAYDSIEGEFETKLKTKEIDELEQITDDFTVAFADWVIVNAYKFPRTTTTKELQEHFKINIYEK
jgi:hypothetical protein